MKILMHMDANSVDAEEVCVNNKMILDTQMLYTSSNFIFHLQN